MILLMLNPVDLVAVLGLFGKEKWFLASWLFYFSGDLSSFLPIAFFAYFGEVVLLILIDRIGKSFNINLFSPSSPTEVYFIVVIFGLK